MKEQKVSLEESALLTRGGIQAQVDIFDIQIPEGERRLAPAGSFEYIH